MKLSALAKPHGVPPNGLADVERGAFACPFRIVPDWNGNHACEGGPIQPISLYARVCKRRSKSG